jgi:hypothetical protein
LGALREFESESRVADEGRLLLDDGARPDDEEDERLLLLGEERLLVDEARPLEAAVSAAKDGNAASVADGSLGLMMLLVGLPSVLLI